MKHKAVRTFTLSLLFVWLAAAWAGAQIAPAVVKADVPFAFSIGTRHYPAGTYSLVRVASHYLALRDADNRVLLNFATNAVEARNAPEAAKLVFTLQDGAYSLAEIWRTNDVAGEQLVQSRSNAVTLAVRATTEKSQLPRSQP